MESYAFSMRNHVDMLKRRKRALILPPLVIFLAATLIALTLPPSYRSSSTLLIEEHNVPADYVQSAVSNFADQRIQNINRRTMSSAKLMEIINDFELFEELKDKLTIDEIIKKMRRGIAVTPISIEVVNKRTGRMGTATIAFTISYEGKDPAKVHQVATRLASMFLEEDLKVREQLAEDTSTFLEEEKNKIKTQLEAFEAKKSAFKGEHINELPELFEINLRMLENIERDSERVNERLRSIRETKGYLETQLASVPRLRNADEQRLEELNLQLANLKSQYSDEYPDVIKTMAEISEIKEKIETAKHSPATESNQLNPAYVALSSQLAGINAELDSYGKQLVELNTRRDEYRRRIEVTPKVEEEYNSIAIEQRALEIKYDDLQRKLMEANVAYGLEKEQKGERFTLIEPARFPETPFKPNRMAIILIGLILGIGAGIGAASLMEFTDSTIHDANSLHRVTSLPVLASIPEIVTNEDTKQAKLKRIALSSGMVAALAVGLAIILFYMLN